jgi:branched-chain amino acid transport system permease protein
MAFLILFEHLAVVIWGSEMRPLPILFAGVDWRIGRYVVSVPQLIGLGLSFASILGLALVLRHTRLGRGLRTIAEDSDTALLLGVEVNQLVPVVFVLAGLFAAVAGALFAIDYRQVHPFMGEAIGLKGISAMIVGGMGNVWGAIIGGLIIGIAEVLSVGYIGANFVDISVFGLLLLILMVRPTGLFLGLAMEGRGS